MIYTKAQYLSNFYHKSQIEVNPQWISLNKKSSCKWVKLLTNLYLSGYTIRYKKASTGSVYAWVIGENKAMKIAIKNHFFGLHKTKKKSLYKRVKQTIQRNNKFGNIALLVGPCGVSTKQAYELIKETLCKSKYS